MKLIIVVSLVFLFRSLIFVNSVDTSTETALATGCSYGFYNNGSSCIDCGISSTQPNVKIVGGIDTLKGSWPAQVLLTQSVYIPSLRKTYTFLCGGTLINRNTVLTSANCIRKTVIINYSPVNVITNSKFPTVASMFTAYLGLGAFDSSFLDDGTSPPSDVIVSSIRSIIVHSSYDTVSNLNDIAILKLAKTITPTSNINIACLPDASVTYPPINTTTYVAGWGTTSEGGTTPYILKNVNLTVYDSSYCRSVSSAPKNWNSQFCAGERSGGKGTCEGDSGGGLMVRQTINGQTKYVVAGVVSYGVGCGRRGYPGIYTRVSYFIDWINANKDEASSNFSGSSGSGVPKVLATKGIILISLILIILIIS